MSRQQIILFSELIYSNAILVKAIAILHKYQAHDILFIPSLNHVNIRMKSHCQESGILDAITHEDFNRTLLALKLSCNMNILCQNRAQSSSFALSINGTKYFIRASIHPSNFGESLSLRMIRSEYFHSYAHNIIRKGLMIIGGRTCSGKTTLLYSILSKLAEQNLHVVTLEDPIEYELPLLVQTDVTKIGYDAGVRSALRQNPDVICIGEIRNQESAEAAIRASLTGHFVIATLHLTAPEFMMNRFMDLNCKYMEQVVTNLIFCSDFKQQYYSLS